VETLCDPKVWVMALFAAVGNIVNSLTNQRQLIVNQFGFTPIQTTLLGCVDGVVEILTIWLGVTLASTRLFGRGYAGALMLIPALLGAILVNTLPSHNKVGLLFSYWITSKGFFISSPSTSMTHAFPKSSLSHRLPFSLDGLDPSFLDTLNGQQRTPLFCAHTPLAMPLDRLCGNGVINREITLHGLLSLSASSCPRCYS